MEFYIDECNYDLITIPKSLLAREYAQKILSGEINPDEISFKGYLHNCSSANGGTLTAAEKPMYRAVVKVELTQPINVAAHDPDDAIYVVGCMIENGAIEFSTNNSDRAYDVSLCCSKCGQEFIFTKGFNEAFGGSLILCDSCLAKLKKEYGLEECK